MQIDVKVQGAEKLRRALQVLSDGQVKVAAAEGVNMAANYLGRAMKAEIRRVFDQPTPYIVNSVWVDRATPEKLSAWVAPTYEGRPGGRQGIDPQKILRAQEAGGSRRDKRVEVALRQMGVLPSGMQISTPADKYGGPLPGSTDARGNLRGPFVRRLLTYLKTDWAMVAGAKRQTAQALLKRYEWQTNAKTRRTYKLMDGMEIFVSDGSRLGRGIWAKKGRRLYCVIAFVRRVYYRNPRINLMDLRRKTDVEGKAAKWIRGRIYEAAKQAGL